MAIAAVTGPVILLGIVFNVLLRGDPAPIAATDPGWVSFMDSWATETLHVVLPIYFVIDLLFAGRRRGLPWSSLAVIVSYPLVWTTYTMLRGESEVVPPGELDAAADRVVNELLELSPLALAMAKRVLNHAYDGPLHVGLELEGLAYGLLRSSHDFREGVEAFVEKRKPEWEGR